MKVFILLYAILTSFMGSCQDNNKSELSSKMILEVTFASTFTKDTVSVSFNGCSVADGRIVDTDLIDGLTDFQFSIYSPTGAEVISVPTKRRTSAN